MGHGLLTTPAPSFRARISPIAAATWGAWALMVLLLGLRCVWDIDFWWQLATGRAIAAEGLPSADLFTVTRLGSPRIESAWLYCRGLAWLHDGFGVQACVVLKALMLLGSFGLVAWTAIRRCGWLVACGIMTVAAVAASQRFVLRPEVVSYACLAVFIFVLDKDERTPTRWVFALPIVQCVWTNCHSYFPLGLLIIGLWALRWGSRGRSFGVFGLCVAATFVNPFGARLHGVAFDHLRAIVDPSATGFVLLGGGLAVAAAVVWSFVRLGQRSAGSGKLGPYRRAGLLVAAGAVFVAAVWFVAGEATSTATWLVAMTERHAISELTPTLSAPVVFVATLAWGGMVCLWLAAVVGAGLSGAGRIRWWMVANSLVMLALSFLAIRNLPLFALAAVPVIAECVAVIRDRVRGVWARCGPGFGDGSTASALGIVAAGLCVAVNVFLIRDLWTDRFHLRQGDSNQRGVGLARHAFALRSADFLDEAAAPREVFCDPNAGSVLLARGYRVFTDPRQVAGLLDEFLSLAESPARLPAALDAMNFDVVVIELRWRGFMRVLLSRSDWVLVHADSEAATFFRRGVPGPTDVRLRPRAWAAELRASVPIPRALGAGSAVSRIAQPFASERAGHLSLLLGDYEGAAAYFREAKAAFPAVFSSEPELVLCEERVSSRRDQR